MTSKEYVKSAINFQNADRIAKDLWIIPAAKKRYGKELDALLEQYPTDIARVENSVVQKEGNCIFSKGKYKDSWGVVWTNIQDGYFGESKDPVIDEPEKIESYQVPFEHYEIGWDEVPRKIEEIKEKFIIASQINPFERMQFIRGVENMYIDLAMEDTLFFRIRDMVWEYFSKMIDRWIGYRDIDALIFSDDWGSQRSLLISPEKWKTHFKPMYADLMGKVKKAKKAVFVHSDGYIMDLYPEFIDLGVDAINSQLWCMDVDEIAKRYAGSITFWGEICRQDTLPNGSPEDVKNAANKLKECFYKNGGGLIGQCEVGADVTIDNIEAALTCWD